MSNLFAMPLLLGLVAFFIGWLTAKFSVYVGARATEIEPPRYESEIRALEASLRVARKEAEVNAEELSESTRQLYELRSSLQAMEETSRYQQEELELARQNIKDEAAKVVDLRRELTDRAEQTIRAQVSARDSENELSLLKAGITFEQEAELDTQEVQPDHLTELDAVFSEDPEADSEAPGWGKRRRTDAVSDC